MLEIILICVAVCADAFAAAYAYGLGGERIRALPAVMIGLVGAVFLGVSLLAAGAVGKLLPGGLCSTVSAAILILIAMKNLVDAQRVSTPSPIPEREAMSLRGSFFLAAALSVDSLGVGFGAGVTMTARHKLYACVLCLLLGTLCVVLGHLLGKVCSRGAGRYKTALASSAILFVIAVMKLL